MLTAAFLLALGAQEKTDFEQKVLPILLRHCFKCHQGPYTQDGKTVQPKAELRLDGRGWIVQGGKSGKVLVPGNPAKSPMYALPALPPEHEDRMPSKGDPLTREEQETIRTWIAQGAEFGKWTGQPGGASFGDAPGPLLKPARVESVEALARDLKPLAADVIEAARKASGATLTPWQPGSPLLRVEFLSREEATGDAQVAALAPLASHVTHLNLGKTKVTDTGLAVLAGFARLTWLDLRQTAVTDAGLAKLAGLAELRSLNLFGTAVTDAALEPVVRLQHLETLYLRETKVTEAGVSKLKELLPAARIVHAFEAPVVPEGTGAARKRKK